MKSFESTSPIKDQIRSSIVNTAVLHEISPGVIFTLTGKEMLDIPIFKSTFPEAQIITIERDKKAYEAIIQKSKGRVLPYNCTVSKYANEDKPGPHHGIVYLDYFDCLTKDTLSEIKRFVTNKNLLHDKPFVLALTFMKAQRSGKREVQEMCGNIWEPEEVSNSVESVASIVWMELSKLKPSVQLEDYMEYRNGKKGVSMYFILFVVK